MGGGPVKRWLFALLLASCATTPKKKEEPPPPPGEAVKAVFTQAYAALSEGDADKLAALFSDDALVFGLGPSDTWVGPVVGTRLHQVMLPIGLSGDALRVEDSRVVVALDETGKGAAAYDLPKVTSTHKAKDEIWLPRITAHLVNVSGVWKIDALHVSLGVPDQLLAAPDAAKRLLPPADVPSQRSSEADEIVGLVRRALDDYAVKLDRTSERPEFIQLGTSPGEVFMDGQKFKALLKPALAGIKKTYSWKIEGALAVKLAPSGKSGWAAALVVQREGSGKKQKVYPTFRFLWLVEEQGGVWNIVSEHQSLAVNSELRDPAAPEALKAWSDLKAEQAKQPEKPAEKPKDKPEEKKDAPMKAW